MAVYSFTFDECSEAIYSYIYLKTNLDKKNSPQNVNTLITALGEFIISYTCYPANSL